MWPKSRLSLIKTLFYLFLISIPFGTRFLVYHFTTGFNEYEAVFLYGSDILMLAFIAAFFLKFKGEFLRKPVFLRIFFALSLVSIFFSFSAGLGVYNFIRLVFLGMAAYVTANILKNGLIKLENIFAVLAGSAILQSLIGIAQFFKQSSLGLGFLGESALGSEIGGAAKIVIEGGKILRAYGTFPHPNVLASFLLLGLCALYYFWLKRPSEWKLFSSWKNLASDAVIGVGIFIISLGLLLAFSRTAWLIAAIITVAVILYSLLRKVNFRQAVRLGILMLAIAAILFFGFRPYILPRAQIVATEPSVSYRLEYNKLALDLIKKNPFGVGIGNQVLYSVKNGIYQKYGMDQAWQWQPIHNIYLLMASEIGVLGLLAFLIFLGKIIFSSKNFIVVVMILSLLAFGLADHFLWTLQPGRLMLWLAMGILIGTQAPVVKRI